MKYKEVVKTVVGLMSSTGVGVIICNAVVTLTPNSLKGFTKLLTVIGGGALATVAAEATSRRMDDIVDTVYESAEELKKLRESSSEEVEAE